MTSTTFISGTTIPSTWLNDVNVLTYTVFNAATTAALARTALGLGTIATQAASSVALTGGSISGVAISGGTITGSAMSGGTLSLSSPLVVSSGGTSVGSFTAYAPICGGTTGTGALQSIGIGTSGQVLTSGGAGVLPTFSSIHSFVKTNVFTTGTAQTFITQFVTNFVKIRMLGGGGGGGGVATSGGINLGGGGGGSGGYLEVSVLVTPNTGYLYTVGAQGIGVNNAAGNTGGNSTITISAITYTASGGVGGAKGTTDHIEVTGGTGGTVTNGDIQVPGNNGQWSEVLIGGAFLSGVGANSQLGSGGIGIKASASSVTAGSNSSGFGSGGSGAVGSNSGTAGTGGNGSGGIIIIDEYT